MACILCLAEICSRHAWYNARYVNVSDVNTAIGGEFAYSGCAGRQSFTEFNVPNISGIRNVISWSYSQGVGLCTHVNSYYCSTVSRAVCELYYLIMNSSSIIGRYVSSYTSTNCYVICDDFTLPFLIIRQCQKESHRIPRFGNCRSVYIIPGIVHPKIQPSICRHIGRPDVTVR